jgi:hypothetical protein
VSFISVKSYFASQSFLICVSYIMSNGEWLWIINIKGYGSMKFRVFWDVLRSQMDVDQRFRGACGHQHQGPTEQPTRLWTSYLLLWEPEISTVWK